jgi:S1-C subfamily serine protease
MQELTTGQNTLLAPGAVSIETTVQPGTWYASGLALVAFALDAAGQATGGDAFLCERTPAAAAGSLQYDPQRPAMRVDTARLPPAVERVAVCAVVRDGAGRGLAFNAFDAIDVVIAGGTEPLRYRLPCRDRPEAALTLVEIYRRAGVWKVRAVGQGYVWGLRKLAQSFGLDLPDRLDDDGRRPPSRDSERGEAGTASGTGFCVNRDGYLVTNQHVVADGRRFTAVSPRGRVELQLLFVDTVNDLAVLKAETPLPAAAVFRDGRPLGIGESIMAVGFPLADLLGSTASVTLGNVSSLAALGDDTRSLRFTAPIQRGNSGGPLLDASGLVVGAVASKLAAARLHELTGDLPENVNFAIKGALIRAFLEAAGVEYELGRPEQPRQSADIAQDACRFVYRIVCRFD